MEDKSHKRLPGSIMGLSGSIMSAIKVECNANGNGNAASVKSFVKK